MGSEMCIRDRISAQMVTKAPCVFRPDGSLSTGQSHALEEPQPSRCLRFLPKLIAFDFLLLYGFLYCIQSTAARVLFKLCDAGSLIRIFARDITSKLKIMLKVDSSLPQMSEPCWSTDCGSTNRIPGYMSTNSSLGVNVNVSTNSGLTRWLYFAKYTCFRQKCLNVHADFKIQWNFAHMLCVSTPRRDLRG